MIDHLEFEKRKKDFIEALNMNIIGEITVQPILNGGFEQRYVIKIFNKKFNYKWFYEICEEFDIKFDTELVDRIIAEYRRAVYKEFFFQ